MLIKFCHTLYQPNVKSKKTKNHTTKQNQNDVMEIGSAWFPPYV